ncbi:MAG TPA: glycine cleavage system protein GcvH [Planctomycetes bacterium]|nr:glycine cleavage system protein GcvH [Planctomycetota bacterium]
MAKVPEDRRYLSSHEWALPEDGVVVVGISEFAAEELGELVYIDLPNLGSAVTARENFGEIESVKAVSELNSPISGKVVAVNVDLVDRLELISKSSYEEGWMIKVEPIDESELENLLDACAYSDQLDSDE